MQAAKGTRDFYPADLLRRRYIEKAWRDTSIRHGFDEIEGPTFETADLYRVKSGEGILAEMFNVYSGKDPQEVAEVRETGRAPLALRPEFTPTLARMYAARAAQLPKPTKWFTAGPYFRAEKPQRGRLREFHQWNIDVLGDETGTGDVEVLACAADLFTTLGVTFQEVRFKTSHRNLVAELLGKLGVPDGDMAARMALLDRHDRARPADEDSREFLARYQELAKFERERFHVPGEISVSHPQQLAMEGAGPTALELAALVGALEAAGARRWCELDLWVVRGLAYYTGLVFEAVAEGERAVCGGGRYDNLVELFGGPPTPAVGFGMGDVVLGNVLGDLKLIPEGAELLEAVSAPGASLRPDVFVISNGTPEADAQFGAVVGRVRRGVESEAWQLRADRKPWNRDRYAVRPLHARRSYKATKNIGKLLEDANRCQARCAAILESDTECTLKNLDTGEQIKNVPLAEIGGRAAGLAGA